MRVLINCCEGFLYLSPTPCFLYITSVVLHLRCHFRARQPVAVSSMRSKVVLACWFLGGFSRPDQQCPVCHALGPPIKPSILQHVSSPLPPVLQPVELFLSGLSSCHCSSPNPIGTMNFPHKLILILEFGMMRYSSILIRF